MHRKDLIEKLQAYRVRWPEEVTETDRFLAFVMRCSNCFDRSLLEGHVTGAGWLVNAAGTHVLLTHHRKLDKWLQLGGHADGDCDVLRVAVTEVGEESGIEDFEVVNTAIFDVDIHVIPERKGVPEHRHYDVRFAFRTTGREQFEVSHESHDLAWVAIDELEKYTTEPSMLRMASKWQAGMV